VPLFFHSSERSWLYCPKLRVEHMLAGHDESSYQQHLLGMSLCPVENEPCRVGRSTLGFFQVWRRFIPIVLREFADSNHSPPSHYARSCSTIISPVRHDSLRATILFLIQLNAPISRELQS
jgi:hypothetical protein